MQPGLGHGYYPNKAQAVQLKKRDFNVFRAGYADFIARGFIPRSDTKPVRLKLPLNWDMDPLGDRNWRFQLHAWRMLQPIWAEFYDKDWTRLKQEVMPWIRDWYDYHVRRKKKSQFMWYDMAAGLRAQHLALLIHLQQRGVLELDVEELQEVEHLAAMHVAKLRNPSFISKGNHGIFQLVGLRLLGIVWVGRSETEGEEAYSCELMGKLLDAQFGPQGVHVENSPDYHNFALTHFRRIRPELFPGIAELYREKVEAAEEVAPWFTLPDGTISAIGDSEGMGAPFVSPAAIDARSTTSDGDEILMRDLSAGGYAIVRSAPEVPDERSSMLIVKAQAFTNSHAHADHLGFELYAFGRALFVDSGKFTYNKDSWRRYFVCDRAHNVVGLAGDCFGPYDTLTGSCGLSPAQLDDEGRYVILGQITRRDFFTHRRSFSYQPGRNLVIDDEVDARDEDAPIAYFHLAEGLDAEVVEGVVNIYSRGMRLASLAFDPSGFTPQLISGQTKPHIQGWISPSYKVRHAATVVELHGIPGLRRWQCEIELFAPTEPVSGNALERPLPKGIELSFPYCFLVDRVVHRPDGLPERRVVVEYMEGTPDSIDRTLAQELPIRGFERVRSRKEQGGIRSYYSHHDGTRLSVLVRPASSVRTRSPGARGQVYLAFVAPAVADAEDEARRDAAVDTEPGDAE